MTKKPQGVDPGKLPAFEAAGLRPFYPAADEAPLANAKLRLDANRSAVTTETRRDFATLLRTRRAVETLKRLPGRGESIHCVLKGDFSLFEFIGAALELSGQPIDELHIATLGFSKKNIDRLSRWVDEGQIKRISVLCSHYFSAADREIFDHAAEFCARHAFPLVAMRIHAKLLAMATGPRRLIVESSANLRSCFNVETATVFDDRDLYAFHVHWMQTLLAAGGKA